MSPDAPARPRAWNQWSVVGERAPGDSAIRSAGTSTSRPVVLAAVRASRKPSPTAVDATDDHGREASSIGGTCRGARHSATDAVKAAASTADKASLGDPAGVEAGADASVATLPARLSVWSRPGNRRACPSDIAATGTGTAELSVVGAVQSVHEALLRAARATCPSAIACTRGRRARAATHVTLPAASHDSRRDTRGYERGAPHGMAAARGKGTAGGRGAGFGAGPAPGTVRRGLREREAGLAEERRPGDRPDIVAPRKTAGDSKA